MFVILLRETVDPEEEKVEERGGDSKSFLIFSGYRNTHLKLSCAAFACCDEPPRAVLSTVHQMMHPSVTGIPSCPGLFFG